MQAKATKGFTMVELLITMAVMVLVIASAGAVMTSGFQTYATNRRLQGDQVHARNALLAISRDVHMADEVWVTGNTILHLAVYCDAGNRYEFRYQLYDNQLRRIWNTWATASTPVWDSNSEHGPSWWPVYFGYVNLAPSDSAPQGFYVEVVEDGRWLEVSLRTSGIVEGAGLTSAQIEMEQIRIALQRIP